MTWLRPRKRKRDAILGHVASWGDRKTPMRRINRLRLLLSTGVAACSRQEACGIPHSDLAWSASGIKQAPRQTALPSKLCAHSTCRGLRMDGTGPIFFYPRRSVLTSFLAACFLADATLFASAQTGAAMIAIDRMTPGSPPTGFSFARTGQGSEGKWTVTEDRTAAAGKGIEQPSTDRPDYRFPLAIHESLWAA